MQCQKARSEQWHVFQWSDKKLTVQGDMGHVLYSVMFNAYLKINTVRL